ncbi:hypothetical protein HKD37_18G052113 [Glycine soja]
MNPPLSSELSFPMISNTLSSIAALRAAGKTTLEPSTMASRIISVSSLCGVAVSTTWFSFSKQHELMLLC